MYRKRTVFALLLALCLCLGLAACGGGGEEPQEESEAQEVCYPVTLNGVEIRVGETTVQALLDAGLQITVSDGNFNSVEVDPETMLEAETYYSGGSVWISDETFAHIAFVTEEEAIPMGEAVIARLEVQMYGEEDASVLEQIAFNGVAAPELNHDKAVEMFPDFTGDENMWLKYGLEYEYFLGFESESGALKQFSVQRSYDVDWNSAD